eukprot:2469876-Amphidinium_carterae.1
MQKGVLKVARSAGLIAPHPAKNCDEQTQRRPVTIRGTSRPLLSGCGAVMMWSSWTLNGTLLPVALYRLTELDDAFRLLLKDAFGMGSKPNLKKRL